MGDDVVHEAHRGLDDAPVEPNFARRVCGAPPFPLIAYQHRRGFQAQARPPHGNALGKVSLCVGSIPRHETGPTLCNCERARNVKLPTNQADSRVRACTEAVQLQATLATQVAEGLTAHELPRTWRWREVLNSSPTVEDPLPLAADDLVQLADLSAIGSPDQDAFDRVHSDGDRLLPLASADRVLDRCPPELDLGLLHYLPFRTRSRSISAAASRSCSSFSYTSLGSRLLI